MRHIFAAVASLCVVTFTASGTTIFGDLEPQFPNSVYTDWPIAAQSFTVPDVDSFLVSWTFDLDARADGGTLEFAIHSFKGGIIGDNLFQQSVARTTTAGLVTIPVGLSLTPLASYVAIYDASHDPGTHVRFIPLNAYSGGSISLADTMAGLQPNFAIFPGADTRFQATFSTIPPPPEVIDPVGAVPEPATLSLTGLVLLAGAALRKWLR